MKPPQRHGNNDVGHEMPTRLGGIGSGRSPHLGAASKCEHWRSIDLADLKRMGLLKPIVGNRIRAITWKNDRGGFDKLGIIPSARGIQFVKRDDQGKLAGRMLRAGRAGVRDPDRGHPESVREDLVAERAAQ